MALHLDVCRLAEEDCRGYLLVDGREELLERHVWATWVAGLQYSLAAAQAESFAPGAPLALVPEPDNPYDEHAVAIWDAARTSAIGHVPRPIARYLRPSHRDGIVLLEAVEAGTRTGILLAAAHEPIQLHVVSLPAAKVAMLAACLPSPPPGNPPMPHDPVEDMWRMAEELAVKHSLA
jgi:HIRAN domain